MEKPGRPQSTGSQRVGHDQRDPACLDKTFLPTLTWVSILLLVLNLECGCPHVLQLLFKLL